MWPSFLAWIMAGLPLHLCAKTLRFLEGSRVVELHEGLDAGAERGPAARHRRRLHRLEQLALGRAVLDRALHVRDAAVLAPAEGEDADDDHLFVLDRQLLTFTERQLAHRLARRDVLGIFLRHPVPERVAVGAGGLPRRTFRRGGEVCGSLLYGTA